MQRDDGRCKHSSTKIRGRLCAIETSDGGNVELTNMQLRPEALNALKLPVKVKAGFLGSVKLKVPWSRLGQEPVLVYLDRILILAEPATQVEGSSEDAIQEAKKNKVKELEMKLLDNQHQQKSEMDTSWLGSLVNTIIGNLKLSITNIHIRYEDTESNPGHPFAAGLKLGRLSAVTIDDLGRETFATGGALEHIQKSVELESLAFYFDSDILPWTVNKSWEDLLPSEWNQIFELRSETIKEHNYILEPVTGNAKYSKLQLDDSRSTGQALQNAIINLDNVTLSLSKDGYRDIVKMADNFASFNQRLRYAHYRPSVSIKSNPATWWKYAYKVVTDETKKASGKFSWEHVLKCARLRKTYISLYASLLKSDPNHLVVDDKLVEELDRELDIDVILQWRMLAHKFVEQVSESDLMAEKTKPKSSWWSFGWTGSSKDDSDHRGFTEEDWEQLNKIIGYKEGSDDYLLASEEKDIMQFYMEIHMKHNASRLVSEGQNFLADLSCEGLACKIKTYPEAKVFDLTLGSYKLSSPYGLLAESATASDSLVGIFSYKPFDAQVDWSFVAKASPCYVTYIKESVDQIIGFFKSNSSVSQTLALEAAAAMQMTIDGVKRSAQQQMNRVLKEQTRFLLDLDIAAPKITIPTKFYPDDLHATKLLLDLGNLTVTTEDYWECDSSEEKDLYLQFNLVLSDVSAFLVDGNYHWSETPLDVAQVNNNSFLPVIEKCGIVGKLQQIHLENPLYPSTRLAVRLPSLGFHFSPARYHRLMQVVKIFQEDNAEIGVQPWNQADFEAWLSLLTWKGVGNREATWKRKYLCLAGPFLYVLDNPRSKTYKQCISLRGKQVHQVPTEFTRGVQNVLALYDAGQFNSKVVEDVNTLILLCDNDEVLKSWQKRLQGTIYRASGSTAISSMSDNSSTTETTKDTSDEIATELDVGDMERLFVIGVLDELRVAFSCSYHGNQSLKKMLINKENRLFEFRAIGGQVELSMRERNIFIGTALKSLEIENQLCYEGGKIPRYIARSFINSEEATAVNNISSFSESSEESIEKKSLNKIESEKFYEAMDDLDDLVDNFSSQDSLQSPKPSFRYSNCIRIPGLTPNADFRTWSSKFEKGYSLDSFVKAQIVIYDQSSSYYNNVDNRLMVTLATLSFFFHRPTILATLEFFNAINISDKNADAEYESISEQSESLASTSENTSFHGSNATIYEDSKLKGLLGSGKSRIIFHLTLNMSMAQIFLMSEDGTSLATLLQNNLLTDIKVFPSSFSIKAALGNLKISDDSLPKNHPYFWVCDMRDPRGSSFVELDFTSFSTDDDDYTSYDYSLTGQLSEVRIVYLNRFVQEVISYFTGLVPTNDDAVVKMKDHVTESEKWVSESEVEGSPAVKLDLSLSRPIILMPRQTESMDYLELDVLQITVENSFEWLGGDKNEISAVHRETLVIKVRDINLTVGIGMKPGKSMIQDVEGLSVVIQRSLRDLLHQTPNTEAAIKVEVLKASMSNHEYDITTECALSNFSEPPHVVPYLGKVFGAPEDDILVPAESPSGAIRSEFQNSQSTATWITMKVSVAIDVVDLLLHSGNSRDSPLASIQASGAWLLYKSNASEETSISATLKGFSVVDEREGVKDEFKLAIGKSRTIGYTNFGSGHGSHLFDTVEEQAKERYVSEPVPSMLIVDAMLAKSLVSVNLYIQRPKLLVALDFLLAIAEFFAPSVRKVLSDEEDADTLNMTRAIILDGPVYSQPSHVFSLSPQRPLVVDDEMFDHFVYDGRGGKLYLHDRLGKILAHPSTETIIYVDSGKRLQFKNVTIVDGDYLDSSVFLGADSSYSISIDDHVFLEKWNEVDSVDSHKETSNGALVSKPVDDDLTEYVIELQAIGPELTFYSTSKDVGESFILSKKVIHANLDVFSRLVIKGDSLETSGNILGLKLESNGITVLEPFDIFLKLSNTSGKTNIHLAVSDVVINFSFSILKLFIAIEEDILAFLRKSTKKVSVVCSQFDRIATIKGYNHSYAFWRPQAPSGYAVLGDCLTPQNQPPSKGVLALNTSFLRVKRPLSYNLIWRSGYPSPDKGKYDHGSNVSSNDNCVVNGGLSIWFPIAPTGYVAVGCVVSSGSSQPPLSSGLCILSSLVSPSSFKDCVALNLSNSKHADFAFWRVDNSFGSFLPANPNNKNLIGKAYELRHVHFGNFNFSTKDRSSNVKYNTRDDINGGGSHFERAGVFTSSRLFESVANFKLVWWNHGTPSQKKLSIWRPVFSPEMVFLGDIAIQGYEPPNSGIVLHDPGDESFLKIPKDFQLVGYIKKQKGAESISFWLPQAPPGFVALGCVASKGYPRGDDISLLRCIRSDMVTGDQFDDESIWNTSETSVSEHFSLWHVDNDLGTFLVRNGFKKPPRRYALKFAGSPLSTESDNTVIGAEIKSVSAAVYDDYGGLMVPLFNVCLDKTAFTLHGRPDYINSTVSFLLAAKSYNDKYDLWEPVIEPMDGFVRYQYDMNAPGASTQLRMTSTQDLNLNVSVSNANMLIQAYSSWNSLNHIDESYRKIESVLPTSGESSILDIHHKSSYYIIPQNKLGQDIYIRGTEGSGTSSIIKIPPGGNKPVKVPALKNMMYPHLKEKLSLVPRSMLTVIIADAELRSTKGVSNGEYMVALRLFIDHPITSPLQQQSARTSGVMIETSSSGTTTVNWHEMFSFKIDSMDYYMLELIVVDLGRGETIGIFSALLKQIAYELPFGSNSNDYNNCFSWKELSPAISLNCQSEDQSNLYGRIRCAILLPARSESKNDNFESTVTNRAGFIQISPSREGPWTSMRLNYAAPTACWRFRNDVVASEVSVINGNRYVDIRSLVSVTNNTDIFIDLCLISKSSSDNHTSMDEKSEGLDRRPDDDKYETEEFFETQKFHPSDGWISRYSSTPFANQSGCSSDDRNKVASIVELAHDWEWADDWHVDTSSVLAEDGWVYAADTEQLNWPESMEVKKQLYSIDCARQRKWIRHRKYVPPFKEDKQISVGLLKPGDTIPLPLLVLSNPVQSYVLQLKPKNTEDKKEYCWGVVTQSHYLTEICGGNEDLHEICVSSLDESDMLLFCSQREGTSSDQCEGLWFCVSIRAKEVGKDIKSVPVNDWNINIDSPLTIFNYLPLSSKYNISSNKLSGGQITCSQGELGPGETVKIHSADIRNPLYISVLPEGGWQPLHEPVLLSHQSKMPSKLINLRSSFSERIVQVILEQNYEKESLIARVIKVYTPYWISVARCPPLTLRVMALPGKREGAHFPVSFHSHKKTKRTLWHITDEELFGGYTIASFLNFKLLGLSASISGPGEECFGPDTELSPLGDMDGSINLYAYNTDNNCMRLLVCSKPSPYQSVPTKVISIRPYMTFTNRIGRDILLRFNSADEPKTLHAFDSRVSFLYSESGRSDKLLVQLEDTHWSLPIEIIKEDTIVVVLRKHQGGRRFVRAEIRGYEEGSRFLVIFRLESATDTYRIENRMWSTRIEIRQSGLDESSWIHLEPLSTAKFSWDDPLGPKSIDVRVIRENETCVQDVCLDRQIEVSKDLQALGVQIIATEVGDMKILQLIDYIRMLTSGTHDRIVPVPIDRMGISSLPKEPHNENAPLELIIELGVIGVSVIDHRPRELLYFYLERVFISYSTGFDAGTTSRFKLIFGYLQLDNQLPLTVMPVLLAPEDMPDRKHPVFKTTIMKRNETSDGTQIYPYIYVRVTEKPWRTNIHEPIIWALMDFYNNIHMDSLPGSSGTVQVDPEIQFELIDVSEIRLKISLETAPAQRPPGALGVWGPILSAVGNAFKIQVHLRKVIHRSRYMRQSSIIPAIVGRIKRDLIHNPLHLIFSVDVLGMTKSTFASLSKGFAELSTDGQFLQLRSKQVTSRRITGVGDGILQGTEALAQGVAFGVSGVLRKPVESARQHGFLGLAHGLGRAFVGFVVQPLSGALDFVSLTIDGIGASFARCLDILNNKTIVQRIRNPRSIHEDGVIREYNEQEAIGQMILYLAEASRHLGCTDIFKEPSKYAWSDYYEDYFILPYQRIALVTNKRVMLLQCSSLDKLDKKPCKILWDVPWENLLAIELAKAGYDKPSHLIIHLQNFRRSESFARIIRCDVGNDEEQEPQAIIICSTIRRMWKAHQTNKKIVVLKSPSSQRHLHFACGEAEGRESRNLTRPFIKPRGSSISNKRRFIKHTVNFKKIWSSEQEYKSRCILFPKQVVEDETLCSIWRPICPDGYVSVGDVAHVGNHPPTVAAVYKDFDGNFALPVGYDLVWRNCAQDYAAPLTIWLPRAPEGYVAVGCVALTAYEEPLLDSAYCVSERIAEEAAFEEQLVWMAPDSYPWSCYIYQIRSEALQFVALRQPKEESDWRPMRVSEQESLSASEASQNPT
ncbi:uncharacterized protein LOC121984930 isoform X2 [Zingiber officinale]|uniref:uncharacterized protein LOC121984930 isoform X2 n=1 Tax=Zingiber officinale TaxID=94328 RepID=UPI001C4AD91E|nr:uncharacterized protein LOC121984930 isoform X2 [Zingiber officinale]